MANIRSDLTCWETVRKLIVIGWPESVPFNQARLQLDLPYHTAQEHLKQVGVEVSGEGLPLRVTEDSIEETRPGNISLEELAEWERQQYEQLDRYKQATKSIKHAVIPDVQAKPGVNTDHLIHVGNYLAEKQPDVIVVIGDFADMESLSSYDRGKKSYEGRTYAADIGSAVEAMEKLMAPIESKNALRKRNGLLPYKPRMVMTLGNHEERILRAIEEDRKLEGTIGMKDLCYEKFGFEVYPFLEIVQIDGVLYSHYFTSGVMGRPVSSAAALLRTMQQSATMGHVQHTDIAIHPKTQQRTLFSGVCYSHDEKYLGPQGNNCRRQIIMKHEVKEGRYDLMEVSLAYLKKTYR
jgi:hypothetical protein